MRDAIAAGLAGILAAGILAAVPPALGGGGGDDSGGDRGDRREEVRVTRACAARSRVKLKLDREDRGLETEVEIDENRAGSTWRVRILVKGRLVATRTGVTRAPSGSFEVRAVVRAASGARVAAVGRRAATGEVCRVVATAP